MLNFPSYEAFLSTHYEKNLWLGRGVLASEYSWSDVNAAMFGWDPTDGRLRLYKDGVLPVESYAEVIDDIGLRRVRILKDKLYEKMGNGATLILNRLDLKCPKIELLTHKFGQYVGERTVANGYASFGGKGAFNKHWDTHDVFAVQLIGRKKWTLYKPTLELPLPDQKSKNRKDECPATPVLQTELCAGDVIYIPRGWWHVTESFPGEETFHIAVGVHVSKVVDYAAWVCGQVMPKHLSSRLSIKWDAEGANLEEFLTAFAQEILNSENLSAYKEIMADNAKRETPFALERAVAGNDDTLPATVLLNSPYRQSLLTGHLISNGYKVKIDEKSRATLSHFLEGTAMNKFDETKRQSRLLQDLFKKDIIFTTD